MVDGILRDHGVFHESGLIPMPASLSDLEASTLPYAAVTAWNALYGARPLQPGQVALTQGTAGVSVFALQFAKAAGATVIATTSLAEKVRLLMGLGADCVINYKEEKGWGAKARALTVDGEGVDNVIEVGGPQTLSQSFDAANFEQSPSYMEALKRNLTVRAVIVGSRAQFEDMNRAIEANKIKPVIDSKTFELEELKEAYLYMWEQKHFGKLCIEIA